ncbi:MAG: hypothetical protein ACTSR1_00565 [Candidatus Heimdallarchaeota archaeon]
MGLEFDTLKKKGDTVIYNNTTGEIYPFYDWKMLIKVFENELGYDRHSLLIFFTKEEIVDFFQECLLDVDNINFEDLKQ